MILSFDVDGPLLEDQSPGFFEFMASRGIPCDYATYAASGDWDAATPTLTQPERASLHAVFVNGNRQDKPTHGAQTALRRMRRFKRHIVTSRGDQVKEATTKILEGQYGSFTKYHFGIIGKAPTLQELSTRFFIEDNVLEACNASRIPGIQVILFPVRAFRRSLKNSDVITLKAERMVTFNMTDDSWRDVCRRAWEEISRIIETEAGLTQPVS